MKIPQEENLKKNIPQFKAGDTVKVHTKVVEGESERVQIFDGIVIARRGSGISATFVVRKTSFGVGVERTFPLHSPKVMKIEVVKRGKVRRAKLYYLRDLRGRAARLEEKQHLRKSGESIGETQTPADKTKQSSAPSVDTVGVSEKAQGRQETK